ncbi:MAG: DUF5360 family protein [Sandaracinobacter sp.]
MTAGLRLFFRIVDSAMLLYWAASFAACLGLVTLPAAAMYDGYGTQMVDAWNWSFLPLDIAFAMTGLWSVRLHRQQDPRWRGLAIVSLVLTMCAGGMAIAFWVLAGDFNWSWWLPNLILLLLPLLWLPRLLASNDEGRPSQSTGQVQ